MKDAERLCHRIAFLHNGSLLSVDTLDNYRKKLGIISLADIFLEHIRIADGD